MGPCCVEWFVYICWIFFFFQTYIYEGGGGCLSQRKEQIDRWWLRAVCVCVSLSDEIDTNLPTCLLTRHISLVLDEQTKWDANHVWLFNYWDGFAPQVSAPSFHRLPASDFFHRPLTSSFKSDSSQISVLAPAWTLLMPETTRVCRYYLDTQPGKSKGRRFLGVRRMLLAF